MTITDRLLDAYRASRGAASTERDSVPAAAGPRALARRLAFASIDWSLPEAPSSLRDAALVRLEALARALLALQREDGTVDSDNLRSPPDTAFVVETLEDVLAIASRSPESGPILPALESVALFCDRAASLLARSGVHTPNHRWVLCGALARAFARTGRPEYKEACLDWLGEGIDLDPEGQFSERSSGIYTPVTCSSLIRVAETLGLPGLLDPVRRALEAQLLLIQPGGEVETIASRRQDQAEIARLSRQAFPFAYMAVLDGDPRFAWAAELALEQPEEALEQLPLFLAASPRGREGLWKLPAAREAVIDYRAYFARSGLVRRRSGDLAISLYGGSDLALDPGLPEASGIAGNPSLLGFRKGRAVCRWLRLRPLFFDLPAARLRLESFDGEVASLRWERSVPYYGSLPRERRRPDGDYELSTGDGRYWSKMSFAERPRTNLCRFAARLVARLTSGGCSLEFEIEGEARSPALIELAFDAECRVSLLAGGRLEVEREGDRFRVVAEGPGAWRDSGGTPTGERGRHAFLGDGEGGTKDLLRWAYEFEAPCSIALSFEAFSD